MPFSRNCLRTNGVHTRGSLWGFHPRVFSNSINMQPKNNISNKWVSGSPETDQWQSFLSTALLCPLTPNQSGAFLEESIPGSDQLLFSATNRLKTRYMVEIPFVYPTFDEAYQWLIYLSMGWKWSKRVIFFPRISLSVWRKLITSV